MNILTIIIASYFIAIPLSFVMYELLTLDKKARLQFTALLLVGGILSFVLAKIGGLFIHDPRPFIQGHFRPLIISSIDNGFPSDHTLLAALIGFTTLSVSRRRAGLLLIVALLIGVARMNAGVHHSWDVLGSFIITGVSYLLARRILAFLAHRHHNLAE